MCIDLDKRNRLWILWEFSQLTPPTAMIRILDKVSILRLIVPHLSVAKRGFVSQASLTGLWCDQIICLTGRYTKQDYPEFLRRVKYYEKEHNKTYVYLTNHFEAPTMQIVVLYINRWNVEIFFKWIKQHLRIKKFWEESPSAIKTQIWIAVYTFVLVAILKYRLKGLHSLNEILQIMSISAFDKTPVDQLNMKIESKNQNTANHNQLNIFDL